MKAKIFAAVLKSFPGNHIWFTGSEFRSWGGIWYELRISDAQVAYARVNDADEVEIVAELTDVECTTETD